MTTIDEIARQAAHAVLVDVRVDATAGFERIRTEAGSDGLRPARRVSIRSWIVLASAAAVIVAVTAAVVTSHNDAEHRVSTVPVAPTDPRVEPSTSIAVATTDNPSTNSSTISSTGVTPTTGETVSTDAATGGTVAVRYISVEVDRSLPVLVPMPFASSQLAAAALPPGALPATAEIAVTADGGAIVFDPVALTASIIDALGRSVDTIGIDFSLSSIVAGPDNVLYGLRQGSGTDAEMVAVALTGPKRGTVLETAPVSANTYSELPTGAFGLGPTGIVDRARDRGKQVIGYVDQNGNPTTMNGTATVTIDSSNVVRRDGGPTWTLQITRASHWEVPETGPAPAAPSPNGGAVYWTGLQTAAPAGVISATALPAIDVAVTLHADGTGQAWILPTGWRVATSDVWGTLLVHQTVNEVQLARFPSDADQHPDTSGLTSADLTADFALPCVAPKGMTIPGPIPGSQLTIIQTASATYPIVGTVEVGADGAPTSTHPDAIVGPTSISASGDVVAAAIDRKGPDQVDVSTDHGATWNSVATVDDARSIALSPDGSTLAVSNGSSLALYPLADGAPHPIPLPNIVGDQIDSIAFAGDGVIVAAVSVPVAGVSSEFAAKSDMFELTIDTKQWTRITDLPADATHSNIAASPVGHADSFFYLVHGVDPSTSQLWVVGPSIQGGAPAQVGNQLPPNAILVGADAYGTNYTFAMNDVDGNYHILTIGASGSVVHDLGCLRPLGATDLNHDPDK